jgi:hypothetical protein
MYYYFPDATIACFEALYLLKKGIPEKNLERLFQPNSSSSLQAYLSPEITKDCILRILTIYEDNREFLPEPEPGVESSLSLRKINTKLRNYIAFYESKFGSLDSTEEYVGEVKFAMEPMSPQRFPHTSLILLQANIARKEWLAAESEPRLKPTKPFGKKGKGAKATGKVAAKTVETTVEKPKAEEENLPKDVPLPFSIHPPASMWTYFVPSKLPSNRNTAFVYSEAVRFFVETGVVGQAIPIPNALPVRNIDSTGLPTKRAVYGISLMIALNDILYSEVSRERISKLLPGTTTVLSKLDMQTHVFRFVGLGSTFVNVFGRLFSSNEQVKSNDTDCVILLHPDLDPTTYQNVYNGIVSIVSSILCPSHEIGSNIVDIRTLKTQLSYVTSPVNVSFFQNYGYFPRKGSSTERIHMNISLFKVYEYSIASTILDVSIYLRTNPRLREVWNLFSVDAAEFHSVPMPNPVALMIEMYNASKLDVRSEEEGGKSLARKAKVMFLQRVLPKNVVDAFPRTDEYTNTLRELYPVVGGSESRENKRKSTKR